ncbi:MAG: serine hydrolase [Clostridia bacterium]|nr:serine hydrolase [Clostridia bacterium]
MNVEHRLQREIEDVTRRYQQEGYFPSACVRVFNEKETLAVVCVGDAQEDSVFDVASLTKIATATQVLLLISQGRLGLHSPLADYFPEIAKDAYLSKRLDGVTLYHLLTHTSTLVDWYPFYSRRGEDFFSVLRYALQHTEPTVGMVYSDLNFMLLGKLLERVQGKNLNACLQEDLVQPLGLGTMLFHPDASLPLMPSCYGNPIEMGMCAERNIAFDGFRPLGIPVIGTVNDGNSHYYFDDAAGHAGIFANALAYEKLCQFYMNTTDELLIDAQREQPGAPGRGLGFQRGPSYPHGCGHTGFTGTGIYFSRECGMGVVSFTNRLYYPQPNPHVTGEFRRALQEAVFALAARI